MGYRLLGALLIFCGCGGFGLSIAARHRKEERLLRQLLDMLDFMESELSYRLTPLPALCRLAAGRERGELSDFFRRLAARLEHQSEPDVFTCVSRELERNDSFPPNFRLLLNKLGKSLGIFDLSGQRKGIAAVRSSCRSALKTLEQGRDARLRSYETLGFCTGAALVILFI